MSVLHLYVFIFIMSRQLRIAIVFTCGPLLPPVVIQSVLHLRVALSVCVHLYKKGCFAGHLTCIQNDPYECYRFRCWWCSKCCTLQLWSDQSFKMHTLNFILLYSAFPLTRAHCPLLSLQRLCCFSLCFNCVFNLLIFLHNIVSSSSAQLPTLLPVHFSITVTDRMLPTTLH